MEGLAGDENVIPAGRQEMRAWTGIEINGTGKRTCHVDAVSRINGNSVTKIGTTSSKSVGPQKIA